jgi:CheY-like chemotaxis protein
MAIVAVVIPTGGALFSIIRQVSRHRKPFGCGWKEFGSMVELTSNKSKPVILVVEDEYLIRMHAAEIIKEAGFEVVEAYNADEAISILQVRKDIRIVFTDIEMPGSMDGLKLAHAIRDRWPPIEIILTSGRHRLAADQIPERGRFFPKPYSSDALVAAIRKL